jgi:hypothetical protein
MNISQPQQLERQDIDAYKARTDQARPCTHRGVGEWLIQGMLVDKGQTKGLIITKPALVERTVQSTRHLELLGGVGGGEVTRGGGGGGVKI